MAHSRLGVVGSQRPGKGGGGVPVDQHHVRLHLLDNALQALEHPGGDVRKGLPRLHDVQVVIGGDGEGFQHLVQHLAVLGGDAHQAFKLLPPLQLFDQGRHFDGLRPGAEHGHDLDLFHGIPSFPQLYAKILNFLSTKFLQISDKPLTWQWICQGPGEGRPFSPWPPCGPPPGILCCSGKTAPAGRAPAGCGTAIRCWSLQTGPAPGACCRRARRRSRPRR